MQFATRKSPFFLLNDFRVSKYRRHLRRTKTVKAIPNGAPNLQLNESKTPTFCSVSHFSPLKSKKKKMPRTNRQRSLALRRGSQAHQAFFGKDRCDQQIPLFVDFHNGLDLSQTSLASYESVDSLSCLSSVKASGS